MGQASTQGHLPPRWASRFLEWYCDPYLLEDLQGDLLEIFYRTTSHKGPRRASWQYTWLVLRSFRWSALRKNSKLKNNIIMNSGQHFKVAVRVLWRDKFNTMLNTLGLTIGIVCFVLMGLYVTQEVTFDHFHTKKDRIYRAWLLEDYGEGKIFFNSNTPVRFENLFEENFPEFEEVVQYHLRNFPVSRNQQDVISEPVAVISPEFFEVFDFDLIHGNVTEPLSGRYDLIISRAYAEKYFGDEDPIGKTLQLQFDEDVTPFTITAVLDDIPQSSSIKFDLAISNVLNRELMGERALTAWMMVGPETYVLMKDQTSIETVNAKSQDVVMSYLGEEMNRDEYNIGFQPLTDIHLNPEIPAGIAPVSNPVYVYVLGIIGLLVLFIACINYTTLSIGQSIKRSREVGMRKILGAAKRTLIFQYLSESVLVALVSMLVGGLLAVLLIPTFNRLTGTELVYVFEMWHLAIFFLIALCIGTLAGIYPAIILTSTKALAIMRSGSTSRGKHWVRKVMVTFQFVITVLLISSALIMQKQIRFLQDKDLGFEYQAFVSVPLFSSSESGRTTERIASARANGALLKPKIEAHPQVSSITMASHAFGTPGWAALSFTDDKGIFRTFSMLAVDAEYLSAFDIGIVEGRDFEKGSGLDERQSILLNETAVDYFGFENPIGKKLPGDNFGEHRIIGVVKDFHFSSLHQEIAPLVITQNVLPMFLGISDAEVKDSMIPKLLFKFTGSQLSQVQEILTEAWESTFPNRNLEYTFLDENVARQYENEARLNKLIGVATVISILIAAIGLLGLTVLVVNSREKEIGIRKVIGASPFQIFHLLARTFSWQLILGVVLSIPLTVWLMQQWLEDFAYRVGIGVDMFALSTFISFFVALVVIGFQAWKAAVVNPVKSLRTE
ncbi:ABC transporter permease [Marinoscillum luteum]|uniref:ABC transporter permease n=1 Tax=Marinoscillum luteum TaxID=861051 RepID=A0ABW7NDC6_9BACT